MKSLYLQYLHQKGVHDLICVLLFSYMGIYNNLLNILRPTCLLWWAYQIRNSDIEEVATVSQYSGKG